MAGRQGRNVPMQGVRGSFAGAGLPMGVGTLGKTPKNRECAKGFAPPPSKKKSFSVGARQRQVVVEPKHSNHLVFYICSRIIFQIFCDLYVMSYNVIRNVSELNIKILYL